MSTVSIGRSNSASLDRLLGIRRLHSPSYDERKASCNLQYASCTVRGMQIETWREEEREMAQIRHYGPVAHLRTDASAQVLAFRQGKIRRSGRGLSFWFMPARVSVAELQLDDRQTTLFAQARSADFQPVVVLPRARSNCPSAFGRGRITR